MGSEADGALGKKKKAELKRHKRITVDTSWEKLLEEVKQADTRTR